MRAAFGANEQVSGALAPFLNSPVWYNIDMAKLPEFASLESDLTRVGEDPARHSHWVLY
jgi:hypothetical protein